MKLFVFSVLIHLLASSVFSAEEKIYSRIVADFNEDGIVDVAYSEPRLCGNAGCWWSIHMGRGNRFYEKEALSVFFHPLAVNISKKEGKPVVTIFHRAGGGEGQLIEYESRRNEFTKISERTIYPDDNGEAKDRLLYDELFGGLRRHRIDEAIPEEEYLEQMEKIKANQAVDTTAANARFFQNEESESTSTLTEPITEASAYALDVRQKRNLTKSNL